MTSLVAMASAPAASAHVTNEVCSRADNRDAAHVALDVVLRLHTCILGIATLCSRRPAFTSQSNVLVRTHRLLTKAIEDIILTASHALHPFVHVFEHLLLDFGVAIVEIRVEAGRDMIRIATSIAGVMNIQAR